MWRHEILTKTCSWGFLNEFEWLDTHFDMYETLYWRLYWHTLMNASIRRFLLMKSPVPGFRVKYRKSKFSAFIAVDYIYISYMSKGESTHQKQPTEPPQLVKVKVLRRIIVYMLCHSKHKNSSIYRPVASVNLSIGLHSTIRDLPFRKTGEGQQSMWSHSSQ